MSSLPFRLASVCALGGALLPALHAVEINWAGANSSWKTNTNWAGGIVPGAEDTAVFDVSTGFYNGNQVGVDANLSIGAIRVGVPVIRFNAANSQALTIGSASTAGVFTLTSAYTTNSSVFDANNNRTLTVDFHTSGLKLLNHGTGVASLGQTGTVNLTNKSGATAVSTVEFGGSGSWHFLAKSYLGKQAGATQGVNATLNGAAAGEDAFSGTVTYEGGTAANLQTLTVDGGTFRLLTNLTATSISVGTGGTLTGSGIYTGATNVAGRLVAGSSAAGTVTFKSALTLSETATTGLRIEDGGISTSIIGNADNVFTLGGDLVVDGASFITGEGSWSLYSNFGSILGGFESVTLTDLGALTEISAGQWFGSLGGFDWSFDSSTGLLASAVSNIPEPSTAAVLLGLGALGAAGARRRR